MHAQVVPTCTCPANRNVKDCCAGIMCALQSQPQFKDWFGRSWHKRELLARRNRADCDPFVDIAQVLKQEVVTESATQVYEDAIHRTQGGKSLLLPDSVHEIFKASLDLAGDDQFLVCMSLVYTNNVSYCSQLSQLRIHEQKGLQLMTSLVQDRQIAHKGHGGHHPSRITYTKVGQEPAKGGNANKFQKTSVEGKAADPVKGNVFKPHNMSPLSSMTSTTIATRDPQPHHADWRTQRFCEFCNVGVRKMPRHRGTKTCLTAQQTFVRYVQCMTCSEKLNQCTGHAQGVACPGPPQKSSSK